MATDVSLLFEPIAQTRDPSLLFELVGGIEAPPNLPVSTGVDIRSNIQPLFGVDPTPQRAMIGARTPSLREQVLIPSVSGGVIGGAKHKFASFAEGLTGLPMATDIFGESNTITEFVGMAFPLALSLKVGNVLFNPIKKILVSAISEAGESVAKKTALGALEATAGGAVFETSRIAAEKFTEEVAGIDTESPDIVERIVETALGFGAFGALFAFLPAHLKRKVGREVGKELKLISHKEAEGVKSTLKLEFTPAENTAIQKASENASELLYASSYDERARILASFHIRNGIFGGAGNRVNQVTKAHDPVGILPNIRDVSPVELEVMQNMDKLTRLSGALGDIGRQLENPIRTFEKLGENTKEMFYRPVKIAERAVTDRTLDMSKAFKVAKSGLGQKSSKRIGVFAIAEQEGGLKILTDGGIKKIPTLTSKERSVYDYMRGELETRFGQLQQARVLTGQEPLKKVQNYFTFFRNLEGTQKLGHDIYNLRSDLISDQFIKANVKAFPFVKRSRDKFGILELDAFGIFEKYNEMAFKHMELSPTLAKSRRLIDSNYPHSGFDLKSSNPEGYEFIHKWINTVAGVGTKSQVPFVEKGFSALNRNLLFATLSLNFRSALIQPSAMVNTATEIGAKWTQVGIREIMKKGSKEFAHRTSLHLKGREYDVSALESFNQITGGLSRVRNRAAKAGLVPLRELDMITAEITWHGAYQKGLRELKLSHTKAGFYADDVVVKTQASASLSDRAPIQRSVLGRTVTLYQTFVINNWGFLTQDVLRIGRDKPLKFETYKKVSRWIIGASAMNIFFRDIIGTHSPFPNPIKAFAEEMKKNDPEGWRLIWNPLAEMGGLLPIVGGGLEFGSTPGGAALQVTEDAFRILSSAPGLKRHPLRVIGQVAGIPGTVQLDKLARERKKKRKEEEKELKKLLEGF